MQCLIRDSNRSWGNTLRTQSTEEREALATELNPSEHGDRCSSRTAGPNAPSSHSRSSSNFQGDQATGMEPGVSWTHHPRWLMPSAQTCPVPVAEYTIPSEPQESQARGLGQPLSSSPALCSVFPRLCASRQPSSPDLLWLLPTYPSPSSPLAPRGSWPSKQEPSQPRDMPEYTDQSCPGNVLLMSRKTIYDCEIHPSVFPSAEGWTHLQCYLAFHCVNVTYFVDSAVDRHVGCFKSRAVTNHAGNLYSCTCHLVPWVTGQWCAQLSEIKHFSRSCTFPVPVTWYPGLQGSDVLSFQRPSTFPERLRPFTFLSSMWALLLSNFTNTEDC